MKRHGKKRHHAVVRVTHWVNVVAITIMVASGLRIFNAYPAFARRGETFCCYPFAGTPMPHWATFGGWLAGARNWHFAMMWVLVINGLIYLGFVYLHGEWRDLVPRRGDARDSWQMVRFYLFLRRDHPMQGKHNALQKAAYFALPFVALAAVLSGLAIWKPVELATHQSARRLCVGAVLALRRDARDRRDVRRPHLHGVRGRPLLDPFHGHRRIQSRPLAGSAQCQAIPAAVRERYVA
jgi:Ni/Fe-hydrogenase b-type cytochrome subunit